MNTSLKYFCLLFLLLRISNCYSQKYFDPFTIDKMKQGDTITFSSTFNEFGEFGGHLEKVYLTVDNDKIWVHYYKQRAFIIFSIFRRICYSTKSKQLSENSKNALYKAINEFNKQLFYGNNHTSNSFKIYKIRTNDQQFRYFSNKKWYVFKRMQRKIFPIGFSFRLKLTKEVLVEPIGRF